MINKGEMEIEYCNDMNVPVNSFLIAPGELDNEGTKWRWVASNFMPRKGIVSDDAYDIEADTKEEIMEAVQKYVVPLYVNALINLKTVGANYYWEKKAAQKSEKKEAGE